MKKILILLFLAIGLIARSQVAINTDGSLADSSAMLDVKTIQKGMLIPRMSTDRRDAIAGPATGLLIFCIDDQLFYSNQGTPGSPDWVALNSQWLSNGSSIYYIGGKIGLGTNNPGAALEISSTTQGFLPPRMAQAQIDALTPVTGLQVFNTTTLQPNYYDGMQWRNFDGTLATFNIGTSCQGGIIAYILQNVDPGYDPDTVHGIITTPSDQSGNGEWGCWGTEIPGADGTDIGTGSQNTIDIVAVCTTEGIAAKSCADLIFDGYSDWYLPSQDELYKLYLNQDAIGGFTNAFYWSSTEVSNELALRLRFGTGSFSSINKYETTVLTRCIRAF